VVVLRQFCRSLLPEAYDAVGQSLSLPNECSGTRGNDLVPLLTSHK